MGTDAGGNPHRHRGVLPIDGSTVFAIDVGEATTNQLCHPDKPVDESPRAV